MSARLREALVQCAHLLADALEDMPEPAKQRPKKLAKTEARRSERRVFVPVNHSLSDLDRERARQALKKAGIPVP